MLIIETFVKGFLFVILAGSQNHKQKTFHECFILIVPDTKYAESAENTQSHAHL